MIGKRLSASSGSIRKRAFHQRFASFKSVAGFLGGAVLVLVSGVFFSFNAATLPTGFTETMIANGLTSPTAMDFAPDGRLFVCLQGGNLRVIKNGAFAADAISYGQRGFIFRVQYAVAPNITSHPSNQTVTAGQSATFNVTAGGSAPLSYQWQRNMVNISGATSSSYTLSSTTLADNGAKFRCVVTNAFGNATRTH